MADPDAGYIENPIVERIVGLIERRSALMQQQVANPELTGDVVLSTRPNTWDAFFAIDARVPSNFLTEDDRAQGERRDLFGDVL